MHRERWIAAASSAACGQFVFVALAAGVLIHAFITYDFSVRYVAENSNSALPLFYLVTTMWGAHEGSMLLWIVVLAVWTMAVVARQAALPREFAARVIGVLGVLSVGFLLFTLSTSNPFLRLIPAAADGNEPQSAVAGSRPLRSADPLHRLYVGFAVSFAFACAAMIEGRHRQSIWARWMPPDRHRWAFSIRHRARQLVGVLRVGVGNGFWFWDPVENASFWRGSRWHRTDPTIRGHRQARTVQELDAAAGAACLLAEPARHLPGAFGCSDLGALICGRPESRRIHPRVSDRDDRRITHALQHPSASDALGRRLRVRVA